MVPLRSLNLESVDGILKINILGETSMDQVVEGVMITAHGFKLEGFRVGFMVTFGKGIKQRTMV